MKNIAGIIVFAILIIALFLAEKIERFLRKIFQLYFYHLWRFALPLFVDSAMIKVWKKLTDKEFDKKIQSFKKKKLMGRGSQERGDRVELNDFTLTREGSLILGRFQSEGKSPKRLRNLFHRFWLGIPALFLIPLDALFIYYYCFAKTQNKCVEMTFSIMLVYSFISLVSVLICFFSDIRKMWIYPRWIFVLLPLLIAFRRYLGSAEITVTWFIGLILAFVYETRFELDEYLEALSRPLPKELFTRRGNKKPICWLVLARTLNDILSLSGQNNIFNSGKIYQGIYFRRLFYKERFVIKTWLDNIEYTAYRIKMSFGIEKEKNIEDIYNKLYNLQVKPALVDDRNMTLLLPYIIRSTYAQEQVSAYCLISYSQERIVCINLPEEIADYMAEKGGLWKAKDVKDVVSSYIDYHHYEFLSGMQRQIIEPVDSLIDPFKLEKSPEIVKKDVTSLIRFEGLLNYLRNVGIPELPTRKLCEMETKLEALRNQYERYLEMSNVIFQAESSRKITRLTKWVVFFSFISFTIGILGIESIRAIISRFGLPTIISISPEFFTFIRVMMVLILLLAIFSKE